MSNPPQNHPLPLPKTIVNQSQPSQKNGLAPGNPVPSGPPQPIPMQTFPSFPLKPSITTPVPSTTSTKSSVGSGLPLFVPPSTPFKTFDPPKFTSLIAPSSYEKPSTSVVGNSTTTAAGTTHSPSPFPSTSRVATSATNPTFPQANAIQQLPQPQQPKTTPMANHVRPSSGPHYGSTTPQETPQARPLQIPPTYPSRSPMEDTLPPSRIGLGLPPSLTTSQPSGFHVHRNQHALAPSATPPRATFVSGPPPMMTSGITSQPQMPVLQSSLTPSSSQTYQPVKLPVFPTASGSLVSAGPPSDGLATQHTSVQEVSSDQSRLSLPVKYQDDDFLTRPSITSQAIPPQISAAERRSHMDAFDDANSHSSHPPLQQQADGASTQSILPILRLRPGFERLVSAVLTHQSTSDQLSKQQIALHIYNKATLVLSELTTQTNHHGEDSTADYENLLSIHYAEAQLLGLLSEWVSGSDPHQSASSTVYPRRHHLSTSNDHHMSIPMTLLLSFLTPQIHHHSLPYARFLSFSTLPSSYTSALNYYLGQSSNDAEQGESTANLLVDSNPVTYPSHAQIHPAKPKLHRHHIVNLFQVIYKHLYEQSLASMYNPQDTTTSPPLASTHPSHIQQHLQDMLRATITRVCSSFSPQWASSPKARSLYISRSERQALLYHKLISQRDQIQLVYLFITVVSRLESVYHPVPLRRYHDDDGDDGTRYDAHPRQHKRYILETLHNNTNAYNYITSSLLYCVELIRLSSIFLCQVDPQWLSCNVFNITHHITILKSYWHLILCDILLCAPYCIQISINTLDPDHDLYPKQLPPGGQTQHTEVCRSYAQVPVKGHDRRLNASVASMIRQTPATERNEVSRSLHNMFELIPFDQSIQYLSQFDEMHNILNAFTTPPSTHSRQPNSPSSQQRASHNSLLWGNYLKVNYGSDAVVDAAVSITNRQDGDPKHNHADDEADSDHLDSDMDSMLYLFDMKHQQDRRKQSKQQQAVTKPSSPSLPTGRTANICSRIDKLTVTVNREMITILVNYLSILDLANIVCQNDVSIPLVSNDIYGEITSMISSKLTTEPQQMGTTQSKSPHPAQNTQNQSPHTISLNISQPLIVQLFNCFITNMFISSMFIPLSIMFPSFWEKDCSHRLSSSSPGQLRSMPRLHDLVVDTNDIYSSHLSDSIEFESDEVIPSYAIGSQLTMYFVFGTPLDQEPSIPTQQTPPPPPMHRRSQLIPRILMAIGFCLDNSLYSIHPVQIELDTRTVGSSTPSHDDDDPDMDVRYDPVIPSSFLYHHGHSRYSHDLVPMHQMQRGPEQHSIILHPITSDYSTLYASILQLFVASALTAITRPSQLDWFSLSTVYANTLPDVLYSIIQLLDPSYADSLVYSPTYSLTHSSTPKEQDDDAPYSQFQDKYTMVLEAHGQALHDLSSANGNGTPHHAYQVRLQRLVDLVSRGDSPIPPSILESLLWIITGDNHQLLSQDLLSQDTAATIPQLVLPHAMVQKRSSLRSHLITSTHAYCYKLIIAGMTTLITNPWTVVDNEKRQGVFDEATHSNPGIASFTPHVTQSDIDLGSDDGQRDEHAHRIKAIIHNTPSALRFLFASADNLLSTSNQYACEIKHTLLSSTPDVAVFSFVESVAVSLMSILVSMDDLLSTTNQQVHTHATLQTYPVLFLHSLYVHAIDTILRVIGNRMMEIIDYCCLLPPTVPQKDSFTSNHWLHPASQGITTFKQLFPDLQGDSLTPLDVPEIEKILATIQPYVLMTSLNTLCMVVQSATNGTQEMSQQLLQKVTQLHENDHTTSQMLPLHHIDTTWLDYIDKSSLSVNVASSSHLTSSQPSSTHTLSRYWNMTFADITRQHSLLKQYLGLFSASFHSSLYGYFQLWTTGYAPDVLPFTQSTLGVIASAVNTTASLAASTATQASLGVLSKLSRSIFDHGLGASGTSQWTNNGVLDLQQHLQRQRASQQQQPDSETSSLPVPSPSSQTDKAAPVWIPYIRLTPSVAPRLHPCSVLYTSSSLSGFASALVNIGGRSSNIITSLTRNTIGSCIKAIPPVFAMLKQIVTSYRPILDNDTLFMLVGSWMYTIFNGVLQVTLGNIQTKAMTELTKIHQHIQQRQASRGGSHLTHQKEDKESGISRIKRSLEDAVENYHNLVFFSSSPPPSSNDITLMKPLLDDVVPCQSDIFDDFTTQIAESWWLSLGRCDGDVDIQQQSCTDIIHVFYTLLSECANLYALVLTSSEFIETVPSAPQQFRYPLAMSSLPLYYPYNMEKPSVNIYTASQYQQYEQSQQQQLPQQQQQHHEDDGQNNQKKPMGVGFPVQITSHITTSILAMADNMHEYLTATDLNMDSSLSHELAASLVMCQRFASMYAFNTPTNSHTSPSSAESLAESSSAPGSPTQQPSAAHSHTPTLPHLISPIAMRSQFVRILSLLRFMDSSYKFSTIQQDIAPEHIDESSLTAYTYFLTPIPVYEGHYLPGYQHIHALSCFEAVTLVKTLFQESHHQETCISYIKQAYYDYYSSTMN